MTPAPGWVPIPGETPQGLVPATALPWTQAPSLQKTLLTFCAGGSTTGRAALRLHSVPVYYMGREECLTGAPEQAQPRPAAATPIPRVVLKTGSPPSSPGKPYEQAGSWIRKLSPLHHHPDNRQPQGPEPHPSSVEGELTSTIVMNFAEGLGTKPGLLFGLAEPQGKHAP